MALGEGGRLNFDNIRLAAKVDRLALLECRRIADGQMVAVVCAVNPNDGEMEFVPLAVMVEGNPYELFEPPA